MEISLLIRVQILKKNLLAPLADRTPNGGGASLKRRKHGKAVP
jgi:hypothetical protein